jgi:WD40 repeat protein
VAVHASRELIASAGYAVRLWNATSGKPHFEFPGHLGGLRALRFTPDGSRLITSGNDTTVRVWDASTRQQSASYELDEPAAAIDVTHDGKSFVTIGRFRGSIDIRNLDDGKTSSSGSSSRNNDSAPSIIPCRSSR